MRLSMSSCQTEIGSNLKMCTRLLCLHSDVVIFIYLNPAMETNSQGLKEYGFFVMEINLEVQGKMGLLVSLICAPGVRNPLLGNLGVCLLSVRVRVCLLVLGISEPLVEEFFAEDVSQTFHFCSGKTLVIRSFRKSLSGNSPLTICGSVLNPSIHLLYL